MKFILPLSLVLLMALVYTEARPGNDNEMQKSAIEVGQKLKAVLIKLFTKVRQQIRDYFSQDDLGEKLKDVLNILLQRLSRRLDNYTSKME
ncbi:unnamed protein product [Heterobilharzia americana]|nr:unnamed protein product [Heterobilharzia americana]